MVFLSDEQMIYCTSFKILEIHIQKYAKLFNKQNNNNNNKDVFNVTD